MEFIGEGDQPPRLSDVKLDGPKRGALEQSMQILLALARMGLCTATFPPTTCFGTRARWCS